MVAVAMACAVSVALAAPASADPPGNWIQNGGSGLCLQPVDNSFDQGVAIVQVACDRANALQRWQAAYFNSTVFQMRNVGTQLCLDARGGATNGTPIQQWPCNSISNEKWDSGPNFVTLRSRVSNTSSHCLDVPAASLQEGVAMQLYRCNSTYAQIWDTSGPDPIIR